MPQTEIVICEYDVKLGQHWKELLAEAGYEAQISRNVFEFIHQLTEQKRADLLILDWDSPELCNVPLESIKEVLDGVHAQNIPVIIFQGLQKLPAPIERAETYLRKPFSDEDLLVAIKKAIQLSMRSSEPPLTSVVDVIHPLPERKPAPNVQQETLGAETVTEAPNMWITDRIKNLFKSATPQQQVELSQTEKLLLVRLRQYGALPEADLGAFLNIPETQVREMIERFAKQKLARLVPDRKKPGQHIVFSTPKGSHAFAKIRHEF